MGQYKDLTYYINKLDSIPDNLWCTETPTDEYGRHDVWGHLGEVEHEMSTEDGATLFALVYEATDGEGALTFANDGLFEYTRYGDTPKQRVVNFLKELA